MGLFPSENPGTYMDGSFSTEFWLLDQEYESANPVRRLSLMSN